MNTTSTHDTKRSEDVRARINVLSEVPEEWATRVRRWAELNRRHEREIEDEVVPDPNDLYLLYQSLVGAWPLGPMEGEERAGFVERVQRYMEKATREAKVHTSWINPDEEYDAALRDFVAAILDPELSGDFLADFAAFQPRVARMGMLNSLSQTALKLAVPGVPDLYQGQEVWDFSLVDPDNRRPVDYPARARMLDGVIAEVEARGPAAVAAELLERWEDGRVKLYLTHVFLRHRKANPELYRSGEYRPLEVAGPRAEHVVAFERRLGDRSMVAVVPRLWATLLWGEEARLPDAALWRGTTVDVGGGASRYRNLLTGEEMEPGDGAIALDRALATFPIALLDAI